MSDVAQPKTLLPLAYRERDKVLDQTIVVHLVVLLNA